LAALRKGISDFHDYDRLAVVTDSIVGHGYRTNVQILFNAAARRYLLTVAHFLKKHLKEVGQCSIEKLNIASIECFDHTT
jgi:hypothetical protein